MERIDKNLRFANNPRVISERQKELLAEHLDELGDLSGVVYCRNNKAYAGGNQRSVHFDGCKVVLYKEYHKPTKTGTVALGYIEKEGENYAYREVEWTEEQFRKACIVANNDGGEWDYSEIATWDQEALNTWGFEMPVFDQPKIKAQDDGFEMPEEVNTDIKPGDIFQIGNHRLMCGDSRDKNNVTSLMDGKLADMVFTDPPYGVAIGAKNRMLNSFQKSGRNLTDIKDDAMKPEDLKASLLPAFVNLRSIMSDHCTVFVTAPQGGDLGMMMMMMAEAGLKVRHVLIWKKNAPTFSMGRLDYDYQHEPILLTWGKSHKYYGLGEHKTSVWEIPKPMRSKEHPTMKPVALVENALLNNSTTGDIIVDFYLGSGTTMVAAEQLGRLCCGMEISPQYCQVIIDRMKRAFPGIPVKKINTLQ